MYMTKNKIWIRHGKYLSVFNRAEVAQVAKGDTSVLESNDRVETHSVGIGI